jgi:hypothetical protein
MVEAGLMWQKMSTETKEEWYAKYCAALEQAQSKEADGKGRASGPVEETQIIEEPPQTAQH